MIDAIRRVEPKPNPLYDMYPRRNLALVTVPLGSCRLRLIMIWSSTVVLPW